MNQPVQPFDVIILDLDMPIVNGFEACMRLRQSEGKGGGEDLQQIFRIESKAKKNGGSSEIDIQREITDRVIIIALSALITDSIIEKIKACGFDDYSMLLVVLIL
jgi:CheY-like chemotaxis protein